MSNDTFMTKRKSVKKPARVSEENLLSEEKLQYAKPRVKIRKAAIISEKSQPAEQKPRWFRVTRAGKQKNYAIQRGFGYFIPSLRRAENLVQVNELIEAGILSKEVEPIIEYLDLKVPEVARAAAVSPSTVSRWKGDSSIGVPGSNQFFRIDEVIKKGVDLFGGLEEFRSWLHNPNMALGNMVPAKLITSHIGVEIVDEALDALHYGNVM